jgi:hypothetical protein
MALKVYKLEQPKTTKTAVVPTVNTEDQPDKGIVTGLAIMVPFYVILAALFTLFRRG